MSVPATVSATPARTAALPMLALLAGNAALALGPWFVRLADSGPVAAGFWRLVLVLPVVALLAWREGRKRPVAATRLRWLVAAAGAFFALDLAAWHIGIELTRLGNAALFGNAGSLVLMLWGLVALRRPPRRLEWLALGAAVGCGAILMGRSLEVSVSTLAGDLFCLFAGLCYVGYLLPAQRARAELGPWSVLALASLAGAPLLLAAALALGEPVVPATAGGWLTVAGLSLGSQLIGQGLLVYALAHFSPLVIGMALLTQPAIAAGVGWAAFGEVLGAGDVIGMVLVSAALVLVSAARQQQTG
ncbi:DMT family transporter [Erythrobacteraceae bacterium CFH 75059]|uniref:DMT family transporter n=1 Tax=Qipengyuania thermophila TaxID=2509361 RepID=UPI0010215934|nr:DMT family transporter [Qipengyuania thermophila]TCD04108.1 DMT family transporter [Erythrobacteraceae bacterium CFH 75059]